jgi:prolyl 4-hydroxylase
MTHSPADQTVARLTQAAEAGDAGAALALARIHDANRQHDAAVAWLHMAARSGSLLAKTVLGCRLLVGRAAPHDPAGGAALIAEAAEEEHPEALHYVSLLAAAGVGRAQSWLDAFTALTAAASRGETRAVAQLELLHGEGIHGAADIVDWLAPPPARTLCDAPRIRVFDGALPRRMCLYLVDKARPKLAAARIQDAENGGARIDTIRNNTGMGFSFLESDVVIQLARAKAASCAGVHPSWVEATNVLHYAPGQRYAPHYDYLDPATPAFSQPLSRLGQRIRTALMYLNDGYDGGETDFPQAGVRVKGVVGQGLVFDNVDPDGRVDPRTLHAGLPPTSGEKWLLSHWIRDQAVPVA